MQDQEEAIIEITTFVNGFAKTRHIAKFKKIAFFVLLASNHPKWFVFQI